MLARRDQDVAAGDGRVVEEGDELWGREEDVGEGSGWERTGGCEGAVGGRRRWRERRGGGGGWVGVCDFAEGAGGDVVRREGHRVGYSMR